MIVEPGCDGDCCHCQGGGSSSGTAEIPANLNVTTVTAANLTATQGITLGEDKLFEYQVLDDEDCAYTAQHKQEGLSQAPARPTERSTISCPDSEPLSFMQRSLQACSLISP